MMQSKEEIRGSIKCSATEPDYYLESRFNLYTAEPDGITMILQ